MRLTSVHRRDRIGAAILCGLVISGCERDRSPDSTRPDTERPDLASVFDLAGQLPDLAERTAPDLLPPIGEPYCFDLARPVDSPPPSQFTDLVYDGANGEVLRILNQGGPLEVWRWNGKDWAQRRAQPAPSLRVGFLLGFDDVARVVVMYGGGVPNQGTSFDDTFLLDGGAWTLEMPSRRPPSRWSSAAAWDRVRNQLVVFSGTASGLPRADTWAHRNGNWFQVMTTALPPARWWHAMAYDEVRQVVVLFGGNNNVGDLGDTWIFDGDWHQQKPAFSPTPRSGAQMAWDGNRQRVVLFGGIEYGAPGGGVRSVDNDTWTWDGARWERADCSGTVPPPRGFGSMVFDGAHRQMLLHGGMTTGFAYLNDTWVR